MTVSVVPDRLHDVMAVLVFVQKLAAERESPVREISFNSVNPVGAAVGVFPTVTFWEAVSATLPFPAAVVAGPSSFVRESK